MFVCQRECTFHTCDHRGGGRASKLLSEALGGQPLARSLAHSLAGYSKGCVCYMPGGGDGIAEHWSMAPGVSHNNAGSGAAHRGTVHGHKHSPCSTVNESVNLSMELKVFISPLLRAAFY